jgi:hypothetical protein
MHQSQDLSILLTDADFMVHAPSSPKILLFYQNQVRNVGSEPQRVP